MMTCRLRDAYQSKRILLTVALTYGLVVRNTFLITLTSCASFRVCK
jgi:hypothetical protein